MKTKIILLLALVFSFNVTFSATPVVRSFSADRTTVGSRQPIGFSWSIEDGGIPEIIFNCPSGIKLWDMNNNLYTCNSTLTVGSLASDAVSLIVTNVSGSTKVLTATITPKDGAGVSYPSLSRTITVNVYADTDPIPDFTVSPALDVVGSYTPVKFTWKTVGLNPLNLQISCNSNIIASSTEGRLPAQILLCSVPIFPTNLNGNDSLTINMVNSGREDAEIKITFLPVIESGSYDAIHAKTVTLKVLPYVVPTPVISSFSISNSRPVSGATTTLSWSVASSTGVIIKSSCSNSLRILSNITSTSTESLCGNSLFSENLGSSGYLNVSFKNTSSSIMPVMLYIIPQRLDGVFSSLVSKSIDILVMPTGSIVESPYNQLINSQVVIPSPTLSNNQTTTSKKNNFTKNLSLGSRGGDVLALQNFLKLYPDLYPEGSVTGYFGPATVRAVKKFQEKYKIAFYGMSGYGSVGPKTRTKLNEF